MHDPALVIYRCNIRIALPQNAQTAVKLKSFNCVVICLRSLRNNKFGIFIPNTLKVSNDSSKFTWRLIFNLKLTVFLWELSRDIFRDWIYRFPNCPAHANLAHGKSRLVYMYTYGFTNFSQVWWLPSSFNSLIVYTLAPSVCFSGIAI